MPQGRFVHAIQAVFLGGIKTTFPFPEFCEIQFPHFFLDFENPCQENLGPSAPPKRNSELNAGVASLNLT